MHDEPVTPRRLRYLIRVVLPHDQGAAWVVHPALGIKLAYDNPHDARRVLHRLLDMGKAVGGCVVDLSPPQGSTTEDLQGEEDGYETQG